MADWQNNEDGTFTYFGYGRVIEDGKLKEILAELVAGIAPRAIARERSLPIQVVNEIFRFFNKMADD